MDPGFSTETARGQIARLAEDLLFALRAALLTVGIPVPPRPVYLTQSLGLDKSISSRVAKALRLDDPVEALTSLPSPEGLHKILAGVQHLGGDRYTVAELQRAIRRYDELLQTYPGGKGGFAATLSEILPENRAKEEQRARQAIHRSMQFLMGVQLDGSYNLNFYTPSREEGLVDLSWVAVRVGFRRLRSGTPMQLLSITRDPEGRDFEGHVRTLGGDPVIDPDACLLRDFCAGDQAQIRFQPGGDRYIISLDEDLPALGASLTVAAGQSLQAMVPRYAQADREYEYSAFTPRIPTDHFAVDTLVHRDLFPMGAPVLTTQLEGGMAPPMTAPIISNFDERLETLAVVVYSDPLQAPPLEAFPFRDTLVRNAFQLLGEDPKDYRMYRLYLKYPLPVVKIRVWFRLPPRPGSALV